MSKGTAPLITSEIDGTKREKGIPRRAIKSHSLHGKPAFLRSVATGYVEAVLSRGRVAFRSDETCVLHFFWRIEQSSDPGIKPETKDLRFATSGSI